MFLGVTVCVHHSVIIVVAVVVICAHDNNNGPQFTVSHVILSHTAEFVVSAEFLHFHGTLRNLVLASDNLSFQFKSKFANISDKTANPLKLTDYFSNQQYSSKTKISPPLIEIVLASS